MSAKATPNKSHCVDTGGGAFIDTAHFTGGSHSFGTVINSVTDNDELKKILSIVTFPCAQADYKDYEAKKKSGSCFPGTREALLGEMEDWVNDPSDSRMYILSGLAGIGKSTVAYTIAARAAEHGLLGASFFFSRDDIDRKNATKFFTTIARQLCAYDESFSKVIRDMLLTEHGFAATRKSPQEQLQVLILEPLRNIVQSYTRSILVVVDALDECDEDDEYAVVNGLSELVRLLPPFKIILTTRPQPVVDSLFATRDDHKFFRLQDIEDKVVDGDIRLYLKHALSLEQVQKHCPKRRWYASDEQIDALVQAAGRLFIIASTAVRYTLDKIASNPAVQMKKLVGSSAQGRMPFKDLDQFYTIILRNVVPVNCEDDIVNRYKSVIGAILYVQHPLPVPVLARLIDREEVDIRIVLDNLQSVVLLGNDDIPRIYHKSFLDYITDSIRCHDINLCINDSRIHHTHIATCCFKIMDQYLKHNILGLGDPARFMDNEDRLKEEGITDEQLEEKVPQQLRYTCAYWVNHFGVASINDVDLMNGLLKFADEHILPWFEVLSLIGKLDSAYIAIRVVLRCLKPPLSDLHQLFSDALRFISMFYEIIERSALHTYYSALPFTPTSSLLYRRYIKGAVDNVWDVEGGSEKWDALVANLTHGEHVDTIKFSIGTALFVSCSEKFEDEHKRSQGILKILDAATGTPISTISGHRFAVTNDFSTIASSKDNTVTFYNVKGDARGPDFTTSSKIEKLALSSESSRVAAALSDGSVWLWDSRNMELIDILYGFDGSNGRDYQPQLEFSATGTRLAYWSANGVIKLRDGVSGRFIADLQCGSRRGRTFVFSGNGSRIASLSPADRLALWNSEGGGLVGDVRDSAVSGMLWLPTVGWHNMAISPDGSLLATAYDIYRVKVWREHDKKSKHRLEQIKVIEVVLPTPMAFSQDNVLVITTFLGTQLYDAKTHSFIPDTLPFVRNPTTVAFSPDCNHLAAGDDDGSIHLWDIHGASSFPSKEDATDVIALAFSPDCSQLACGFTNGAIELFETISTKRRLIIPSPTWMKRTLGFDLFHKGHRKMITMLTFSPSGGLFASVSDDGRIKLWNAGDGSLRGTINEPNQSVVAISNSMLAVAPGGASVTLWTLNKLNLIHTFKNHQGNDHYVTAVSITENSTLVAVSTTLGIYPDREIFITLFDIVNRTIISTFTFDNFRETCSLTFLADDSQLVAQTIDGDSFLSLNLVNKRIIAGPIFEYLIQLPNIPLWHGVPIWYNQKQHCLSALFCQDNTPVPMLWIPGDLTITEWTHGPSMIALLLKDKGFIVLRLRVSNVA